MSSKTDRTAAKAVQAAKVEKVRPSTSSPDADRLKVEVRKHVMHVASFAVTTITFVTMVLITLGADAFVRDVVFAWFNTKPTDVLAVMFKVAKYAALGVELAFWVNGVYRECKHHSND